MNMTDELFEQLPKEQLLKGAKHCLTNAAMHFDSAKEIAKLGHYSIANSLLILAAEEAVKGYILTSGFFSVPLPFRIAPIFRNHKSKHTQAQDMESIVMVAYAVSNAFSSPKKHWLNQLAQALISAVVLTMTWDTLKPERKQWWSNANEMKNRGFYVDFQNGDWIADNRITEENYKKTLETVEPFLGGVKHIMSLNESDYKGIQTKTK
jgi:AbiV family abortive infection protein